MASPHPHDALFREVFCEPADMAGLLRSALPPALTEAIRWESLRPVPGSFVDEAMREHRSDLLFQVGIGDGDALIYVLCEHKSRPEDDTVVQLLRDTTRIWEVWRREHPGGPLPAVLPVVVHHGERPWTGARSLWERTDARGIPPGAARELCRLGPELGFVLDDLATQSEEHLEGRALSALAAMTVLLLRHARGRAPDEVEAAMGRWQRLVAAVLERHGQERLLLLFSYLFSTTEVEPERMAGAFTGTLGSRLEETLMSTAERLRREGNAEGHAEGHAKGRAELLLRLLAGRFGAVPREVEDRVRAASIPDLDRWADAVLTADTLDEVLDS